jgi:hypothetical protein
MFFTLKEILNDFEKIINLWFDLYQTYNCQDVINLYFGIKYNPYFYPTNEFLFLAQSLEGYHRRKIESKDIPFANRIKKLFQMNQIIINELTKTIHPQSANDKDKDKDIEKNVKKIVEHAIDNIVKKIDNSRYYYTHYFTPEQDKEVLSGEKMLRITQIMDFIFQACLLNDLEFSEKKIKDLISRSPEFSYLKQQFQTFGLLS